VRGICARPLGRSPWVEAAPFRAHVRHTTDTAGVPWPALAVLSGVSVPAVHALLFGRRGRALTRLEPRVAARLLSVGTAELRGLRRAWVAAEPTAVRLRQLLAGGLDPLRVARWCDLTPTQLADLVDGDAPACSQLTETLVLAADRLRVAAPQPGRLAA